MRKAAWRSFVVIMMFLPTFSYAGGLWNKLTACFLGWLMLFSGTDANQPNMGQLPISEWMRESGLAAASADGAGTDAPRSTVGHSRIPQDIFAFLQARAADDRAGAQLTRFVEQCCEEDACSPVKAEEMLREIGFPVEQLDGKDLCAEMQAESLKPSVVHAMLRRDYFAAEQERIKAIVKSHGSRLTRVVLKALVEDPEGLTPDDHKILMELLLEVRDPERLLIVWNSYRLKKLKHMLRLHMRGHTLEGEVLTYLAQKVMSDVQKDAKSRDLFEKLRRWELQKED